MTADDKKERKEGRKKITYTVPLSMYLGHMIYKSINKSNFSSFGEFIYGEKINKRKH